MTGFDPFQGYPPPPPSAFDAGIPPPPGPISVIRAGIAADLERLGRELGEIEMLMGQATAEAERHEARRAKGEDRVSALERDPRTEPAELSEARTQVLLLTRRAMLFEAQQQVLEGKHKALSRYRDRLVQLDGELVAIGEIAPLAAPPPAPPGPMAGPPSEAVLVLRSQEELRRDIVRQLHDGPTQSLANVALQAEIVQRLVGRDDARAQAELESLRRMVQHALDTTKEFIFEVRPMVLDDLGLVPTLRRAAADRGRRAAVVVDFDSHGTDRRLPPDLESGLFRCVDEAVAGYLALRPPSVIVRLDWSERELVATVQGGWPRLVEVEEPPPLDATTGAPQEMPVALQQMIEEKRTQAREARTASRSLAPERLAEIGERARVLGVSLSLRDEGQTMELAAQLAV